MEFIDISNWNEVTDYSKLKKYEGVICKATEGSTFIDKTFLDKVNNLKANGVNVGAYHFLTSTSSPESQADLFYRIIKDLKLEIIPVLDIEDRKIGIDSENFVDRFVDKFTSLGGEMPIIYSEKSYIQEFFSKEFRRDYNWWVANYKIDICPTITNCQIVAWQYTEEGIEEGVVGGVDKNILYLPQFFYSNMKEFKPTENNSYEKEYEENATATVQVNGLRVRTSPSLNSQVVASYDIGDSFMYDYVVYNDGYVWCRYIGKNSGQYRYVAVRELATGKRYAHCE